MHTQVSAGSFGHPGLYPRKDHRPLRRLLPGRQRVLLRPPPALLQLHPQLLPHRHSARHRRDVYHGLQRRPGVLDDQRGVPGVLLPEQVQHPQGARPRGDEEGGQHLQDRGAGGLRQREVCQVPDVFVGLD